MGAVITEKARQLIEDVKNFLSSEKIVSLTIETAEQYEGAGALIKELKIKKTQVESKKKEESEGLYSQWKETLAEFSPIIDAVDEKIKAVEQAGREYRRLEEQKYIELTRKYEAEAEAARKLIEDQAGTNAEKATKLREKAVELRAMAASGCTAEDATRYENEARKYDHRALKYDVKVEIKMQQAAQTVAPIVAPVIPKNTRGAFNTKNYYRAKVKNVVEFLLWVIKEKQFQYIEIKEGALNNSAQGAKGAPSTIGGVEFYQV